MNAVGAGTYGPISEQELAVALLAARDRVIVGNALTLPGGYAPYCMRCPGFHRMASTGLLRWRHYCGAEHDEAEARAALVRFHKFPYDACSRADAKLAPLRLTQHEQVAPLDQPDARLQRVTSSGQAARGAVPAFWSLAYRPEFVQRAALALGWACIAIVTTATTLGVL